MTDAALTEKMIRVALLFQKTRGETQTDAMAVYATAKALGITEAAVLHCTKTVAEDRTF